MSFRSLAILGTILDLTAGDRPIIASLSADYQLLYRGNPPVPKAVQPFKRYPGARKKRRTR